MNGLMGKRFMFAVVGIICVTVTTCLLKYNGDIYLKLVGAITLIFTAGQTITDIKDRQNGGGQK